ncbi:MAG: hypothetical protein ACI9WS_000333 [Paraglaciecola psychrophila]|jgi:hypothetical protein
MQQRSLTTASVRLAQHRTNNVTIMAKALHRTPPKQIENEEKVVEIMADNPDVPYKIVKQTIFPKTNKKWKN